LSPALLLLAAAPLAVAGGALSMTVDLRARPDAPVATVRCYTSGMRVAVATDHRAPWTGATLVFDGGQRHDPAGKRGLAHLTEHLQFQAELDGVRLADRIAGLGLEMNAYTSAEVTVWPLEGPTPRLGAMLGLHASRMKAGALPGVDADRLAQEKAAVMHERADRGFSLAHAASDWLTPHVYPEGLPPLPRGPETAASVDAILLADARAFAERWYQPMHATLVIRGDVDPGAGFSAAEVAFGPEMLGSHDPGGSSCTRRTLGIRPTTVGTQVGAPPHHEATVTQPTALLGWALPGAWDPAALALHGVTQWQEDRIGLLLGNLSEGELRPDDHPDCRMLTGSKGSLLACVVPVVDGYDPDVFAAAIRGGLGRIAVADWEPEAVLGLGLRLRRQRTRRAWPHASPLGDASALDRDIHLHMTGRGDWMRNMEVARVSRDGTYAPPLEALAWDQGAAVVLTPPPLLERLSLPSGVPPLTDPALARAAVSGQAQGQAEDVARMLDAVPSSSAAALPPPDRGAPAEVQERVLDNGVRVRVLARAGAGTVRVTAAFRAMDELTPDAAILGAALTAWRPITLTDQRPATPAVAARRGGLEVNHLSHGEDWALSIAGDAHQLPVLASLAVAHLENAVVDGDWLRHARRRLRRIHNYYRRDASGAVFAGAWDHVYGGDPSLSPVASVQAGLRAKHGRGDLERIERARGATAGAQIIVVGNVDAEETLDLFERALSDWAAPSAPRARLDEARPDAPVPSAPAERIRIDRDADRSTLLAACRLPDGMGADEAIALQTAVRHQAFSVMREQADLTYGLSTQIERTPDGPAALMLVISTAPASSGPAAVALRDLLTALSARDPNPAIAAAAANRAQAAAWASGADDLATTRDLLEGATVPRPAARDLDAARLGSLMHTCGDAAYIGAIVPGAGSAARVEAALRD
jgi:predicted Zn-dependent peptidase